MNTAAKRARDTAGNQTPAQPSPRPWAVVDRDPGASAKITDADGEFIAWATYSRYQDDRRDPEARANVEYLIGACNAHDDLVNALRAVTDAFASDPVSCTGYQQKCLQDARATLAKVRP